MNYQKIQKKWAPIAKKDPIEAPLAVEKDLGRIPVVRGSKWGDSFFSELPTSNVPKNVKNAETINAILVKSYETQGSYFMTVNHTHTPLAAPWFGRIVNGLLMYYFKSMSIADNMERIVGLLRRTKVAAHSWLKLNDHYIDNTFAPFSLATEYETDEKRFNDYLTSKYIDTDPSDPEYVVNPLSSEVGLENERLLFGKDEKVEQIFVQLAASKLFLGLTLYDIAMRKFIKEKYGVEVENLVKKWSKLCWNCFVSNEDVKKNKCSKCGISRYCGRDCQVEDWKVHKKVHAYVNSF